MKHKISLPLVLLVVLLTAATTFNITYIAIWNTFNQRLVNLDGREQTYDKLAEIYSYVDKYYIEEYDENVLADGAAKGLTEALPDKWSGYMSAEEYASYTDTAKNNYVGIGLKGSYDQENKAIRINEVYAEGPASEAGLRYFDLIIAVDGKDIADIGFDAAIDSIRGKEGTTVEITYIGAIDNETKTVSITRREVKNSDLQYELLDDKIGYIRIKGFNENVDTQFLDAVNDLQKQGARALVFDVRLNPGGRLDVLRNMLDPLLPEGKIIELKDKNGKSSVISSDANELNIPMAVLVNEYSYSAAEFFAAALQEYGKAKIIGTKTTGKSFSQNTIPLKDGSALILSTEHYYTPKGVDLVLTGVTPDVEVKMTMDEMYNLFNTPHSEDKQLSRAIDNLKMN